MKMTEKSEELPRNIRVILRVLTINILILNQLMLP